MIGQLFVQIYPHPACARMHGHFAESYREASLERPKMERQQTDRPKTLAAVA